MNDVLWRLGRCAIGCSALWLGGCAQLLGFEDSYTRDSSDGGGIGGSSVGGDGARSGGSSSTSGGTSSGGSTGGGGTSSGGSGGSRDAPSTPLILDRIAAGTHHACGIRPNGSLVCWGGFSPESHEPPPGTFVAVACGNEASCALDESGYATCWGWLEPATPPNVPFSEIALFDTTACGIRLTDGILECWGSHAPTPPAGEFSALAVGNGFGCGLDMSGAAVCWDMGYTAGSATYSQLSCGTDHACARVASSGVIECWGSSTWGATEAPTGVFSDVSAGDGFTCGVRANGQLTCWGSTFGTVANPPGGSFSTVSVGSNFACALTAGSSEVRCWGNASYGGSKPPAP